MEMREKSNLLAVSVVVKDQKGNIYLRKRIKEPDLGKWELFASYPYVDELPLTKAVERILREKAGIMGAAVVSTGKYYDEPKRHAGAACVPVIFVATVNSASESESRKWFAPTEIADLPMALDNKQTLIDLGLL